MLDRVFAIVLLLNLTGLFSFVAIAVGLPIAYSSATILVFLLWYLLSNYKIAFWFLRKKEVFYWTVFALAWPAVTSVYAIAPSLRLNAINVYVVGLALATAIWTTRNGIQRATQVLLLAGAIGVAGLLLSMVHNDFFQSVAEAADAHFSYFGRAFGFFLQPNMAAENLGFLFALLLPAVSVRRRKYGIVVTGFYVISVLLTGSRGGIIICFCLVIYAYALSGQIGYHSLRRKTTQVTIAIAILFSAMFAAGQIADYTLSTAQSALSTQYTLADRLGSVRSLNLNSAQSGSITARLVALNEHGQGIVSRPLIGYGLGASSYHASIGVLTYTSHNQYAQVAYDLGIPALLLFLFLIFGLWRRSRQSEDSAGFICSPGIALAIALVLSSMFSNSVLNSRVFFATLGIAFAIHFAGESVRAVRSTIGKSASGSYSAG